VAVAEASTWVVTLTRALGLFLGILGDNYANARRVQALAPVKIASIFVGVLYIGRLVFRCLSYGSSTLPNHIP